MEAEEWWWVWVESACSVRVILVEQGLRLLLGLEIREVQDWHLFVDE